MAGRPDELGQPLLLFIHLALKLDKFLSYLRLIARLLPQQFRDLLHEAIDINVFYMLTKPVQPHFVHQRGVFCLVAERDSRQ